MSEFDSLSRIDLDTLDSMWAFQTRNDRKYVVEAAVVPWMADELPTETKMLEIEGRSEFSYQSVYFDTPQLRSFRDAAHHRRRRFKVRTRTYLDSGLQTLEVKTKDGRGRTIKHRIRKSGDAMSLTPTERGFISRQLDDPVTVEQLRPTLINRYRRTTLALPALEGRVTVDTGLAFWTPGEAPWFADHIAIVETKAGQRPTAVDRWLWAHQVRPSKMSKYCTALAVMQPDLPANKWGRVISRHLQDAGPVSTAASRAAIRA
jgi:hypothetical protein